MTRNRQRILRVAAYAAVTAFILIAMQASALAVTKVAFGPVSFYNYNAAATGVGHDSVIVNIFSVETTHGTFPDIVVPNGQHNNLSLFANFRGNGTFATGTVISNAALNFGYPTLGHPQALSADFNSNSASGYPDLLVTNQGNNTVATLLGNGSGGFSSAPTATVPVGTNPLGIARGDFNADGLQDFVTANGGSADVSVRIGDGNGGFSNPATASPSVSTSVAPLAIVTDDFNNDGMWDFAVAAGAEDSVRVFLGNDLGGFHEATGSPYLVYSGASPVTLSSGDFNGDGISDIITSNAHGLVDPSKALTVMLGTGTGAMVPAYNTASGNGALAQVRQIAVGQLQSLPTTPPVGSYDDAVAPGDVIAALLNGQTGAGTFASTVTTGLGGASPASAVSLRDVNGDGNKDIVAAGDNQIAVQFSTTAPPTTEAFGTPSGWNSTWVGQDVNFSLVASDPVGTITGTFYTLNGGFANLYSIPVTISAEGTTTLGYWSTDSFGFTEPTNTATIRIDKTVPTITLGGIPATTPPAPFGWTNQQVSVTLSPADTLSGVAGSLFTINGSAPATYAAPLIMQPLSYPGTNTVTGVAVDNVGLHSTTATAQFGLDGVVPVTTIATWGVAPTGWINAASAPGGYVFGRTEDGLSPMTTHFSISANGGPTFDFIANIGADYTDADEGTTTVLYQTTDLAGNVEATKTATILKDTQLPSSSISGVPGQPVTHAVGFGLSATDPVPGSGVAAKYYTLDSNPATQTYTTTVTVSAVGDHTVHYWAADVAGNVEGSHTATFTIWPGPPTTTIVGVPPSWVSTNVTFTLDATSLAPPVTSYYTLNGGSATVYTGGVGVTAEGTTTVQYWSVDSHNQTETAQTAFIRIDKTAPLTTSNALTSYIQSATITVSAVDTLSGVASKWYSIDGAAPQTYTTPVVIGQTGHYAFAFGSVDNVGNRSATQTVDVQIHPKEEVFGAPDRYESAVLASRSVFATGSVDTVVIATGQNFPDALSAGPLAGAYAAPVLLTRGNALPPSVSAELTRLGATHAIIVGGTGAVLPSVQAQLVTLLGGDPLTVVRISGAGANADRYGTAAAVAAAVKGRLVGTGRTLDGTVFIATGTNYPDALSGGANGWKMTRPILLVKGATIPASTSQALGSLPATRAVVLGGTGVIPDTTVAVIQGQLSGDATTLRKAGATRYDTAAAVAEWAAAGEGLGWGTLGVATGQNFPDALVGGPVTGKAGGVMLLTMTNILPTPTQTAIQAHSADIQAVKFFGGDGAVSPPIRAGIMNLLP